MSTPSLHRSPEAPPASEKDALIGRLLRWSLLLLIVGPIGIGIFVWLFGRFTQPLPPVELPYTPPQHSGAALSAPPLPFTDITLEAGIDFIHVNGASGEKLLPETMGGGCAFLDFDNDGDQDLLFVNSATWPWQEKKQEKRPTLRLYQNNGAGQFVDVSTSAGFDESFYGMGVAVGDYDNDGWIDLFATAVGGNHLFHNNQGRFTEVTAQASVAGTDAAWSTGAAFVDIDNDGDLDLFVANYVEWSRELDFAVDYRLTGIGRAYGPPTNFPGTHSFLYRNEGNGAFVDITAASGLQVVHPATGKPIGKALGVIPIDVDQDGWVDLIVANDTVRNFFFHNRGDGTFVEKGSQVGLAFDRNGNATGAMGIDAAWYRNDDALGIAIGNFAGEMTSLYVSQGTSTLFVDEAIGEGIGAASRLMLTFGAFFFDADLDGCLDLLHANGHLEQDINVVQPSQSYRQPAQLFWNAGAAMPATFVPVSPDRTGDLATPIVGRGAAYADIDNDGDLDVVLTQIEDHPLLLRNNQNFGHHWLRVKLVGHRGNRDAIGARIALVAAGVKQRRYVMPMRSYLSQMELPVTFGLGRADRIDALTITWPNGEVQELTDTPIDTELVIEQGMS
ncbi:MAG: CRTAC1 family protein [Candidatus Binatia bacterium]